MISDIETPVIVFNNSQCLLKGGFWDGRLELNNLNLDTKEDPILLAQTIFNPDYSPIVVIEKAKSEKFLFCGTMNGNLISYKINQKLIEFKRSLCLFDSEITSISINEKLNMFAVSSKDGFINLHILPSYNLVRTISLNYNKKNGINKDNNENENENNNNLLYANNIFLSSSPLGCITVYISSRRLFKSFTLNGEFICECKECDESFKIKSPIIYTNNSFQDILVYGTNDGSIKFRKFPEMSLINSIEVFPGEEINTICINPDNKLCYVWSSKNIISVIKISIN
jgi:WD40 repeat protein